MESTPLERAEEGNGTAEEDVEEVAEEEEQTVQRVTSIVELDRAVLCRLQREEPTVKKGIAL